METAENRKENKHFTEEYTQEAIEEAIKQDEPLVISNELKLLQVDGIKLTLFEIKDYEALKEGLSDKNTAESCLKLVLAFDSTDEGQKLKNTLKSYLKGFKYDFIVVDWQDLERSGNINGAVAKAKERVNNIGIIEKEIKKMNAASNFMEYLKHIESLRDVPAIKTGFNRFDEALGGGLRGGRLYAIGAISSLGKTSFALNIADNIAYTGRDVLIFSLEMGKYELMTKSISRETFKLCLKEGMNINNHQAFTALEISDKFSYEKYSEEKKEILQPAIDNYTKTESEHIYISEGIGDIGVKQIRETIDNFKQLGHPAPVVIVDYMQILSPYNERLNDKQNIDKNMTELKRISRDYNIPVIVISSFNRTNYLNEVGFESFKESGSIEYSADVLIGLQLKIAGRQNWTESKPALNEKREMVNEAKVKTPRDIELVILKNRMHKAWDKIDFNYYPQFDYFEEIDKGFVATSRNI